MWFYVQDKMPETENKQFLVMKHYRNTFYFDQAIYANNSWWIKQFEEETDLHIFMTQDPGIVKQEIVEILDRIQYETQDILGWVEIPENQTNLESLILKENIQE